MAIAINPKETFDYVLRSDRELPEEERTVWHLRALTFDQRTKLEDKPTATVDMQFSPRVGSMKSDIIRAGLAGWTNFRAVAADGRVEVVEYETEGKTLNVLGRNIDPVAARLLNRIHPVDLDELCNAITEVQRVSLEEGKD